MYICTTFGQKSWHPTSHSSCAASVNKFILRWKEVQTGFVDCSKRHLICWFRVGSDTGKDTYNDVVFYSCCSIRCCWTTSERYWSPTTIFHEQAATPEMIRYGMELVKQTTDLAKKIQWTFPGMFKEGKFVADLQIALWSTKGDLLRESGWFMARSPERSYTNAKILGNWQKFLADIDKKKLFSSLSKKTAEEVSTFSRAYKNVYITANDQVKSHESCCWYFRSPSNQSRHFPEKHHLKPWQQHAKALFLAFTGSDWSSFSSKILLEDSGQNAITHGGTCNCFWHFIRNNNVAAKCGVELCLLAIFQWIRPHPNEDVLTED